MEFQALFYCLIKETIFLNSMKVVAKRILIVGFIVATLIVLEVTSEESMMNNLPTHDEIVQSIIDRNEQTAVIDQAFEDGYDQEAEYEKLFSYDIRHTFVIEFTQEEWDGLNQDMYDYYEQYGNYRSNNYRRVNVTYIAGDEITEIQEVGIRSKGNDFSRVPPESENGTVTPIHYMMKFNETFDYVEGTDEYDDLKTRDVFDIEQLLFKSNNTNDPGYTNEVFSYEMFRQVGVPIVRASYADVRLVVAGKVVMVELYNIFEQFDEEFIRKSLQEVPRKEVGDLYKGLWSGTLDPIYSSQDYGVRDWESNYRPLYGKETNKDVDTSNLLIDFSFGININDLNSRKEFIENYFNIDNFMRAMAVNVLVGNPDDYRGNANNFYYYFDEVGYLTYLPFDYDNSMGAGWPGHPSFINYTLGNDIYEWGWESWMPCGKPLWDNTIVYEEYQILYEDYLIEFIEDGTFSEESYLAIYNKVEEFYSDIADLRYDKTNYITTKIEVVTEDVEYYKSQR